jgi:cytochrome P450
MLAATAAAPERPGQRTVFELWQATIWEVQRIRPVLDAAVLRTQTRIPLEDWVIPESTNLIFSIKLVHDSEEARHVDSVRRR